MSSYRSGLLAVKGAKFNGKLSSGIYICIYDKLYKVTTSSIIKLILDNNFLNISIYCNMYKYT